MTMFSGPRGISGAILLAAAALLPAPEAWARPMSTSMSCAQTAALVRSQGAVVIGTGPELYDRYVNDKRFCYPEQDLKPEWVPTRDQRQCFIGYTCYDPSRDHDFR